MICNKNYLADILRVCEIKDLIWVMRFQSPLVYFRRSRAARLNSEVGDDSSEIQTHSSFNGCP